MKRIGLDMRKKLLILWACIALAIISIVEENHLTCMMITHNMQSALELGNRTIMMNAGRIIYDVSGKEREGLTVNDLLEKFRETSGKALDNDRMLLGL